MLKQVAGRAPQLLSSGSVRVQTIQESVPSRPVSTLSVSANHPLSVSANHPLPVSANHPLSLPITLCLSLPITLCLSLPITPVCLCQSPSVSANHPMSVSASHPLFFSANHPVSVTASHPLSVSANHPVSLGQLPSLLSPVCHLRETKSISDCPSVRRSVPVNLCSS